MGFFKDSDLKTRRIGQEDRVLVAAPSYLDNGPNVQEPLDLQKHNFVSFSLVPDLIELTDKDGTKVEVWGETVVATDSAETSRVLALTGLGIAALPHESLKAVLPISLTWPNNATLNKLTREFVDFLSGS